MMLLLSQALAGEIAVGGYVGYYAAPADSGQASGMVEGGRLRYRIVPRWGLEASVGAAGERQVDPRLEGLYFFGDGTAFVTPFLAAGGGAILGGRGASLIDFGFGIDSAIFPIVDLRTDLRFRVLPGQDPSAGFYANLGLSIHSLRPIDRDGDGVLDRSDRCLGSAEDRDGFDDGDGCADPDNDGDGVPDSADRCAAEGEDRDGFDDTDGCPEPDNDGDDILDPVDRCMQVAEDADSFEDADGCPDPDNDGDGILDGVDTAPAQPETKNRYLDRDGVPDEIPAEVRNVLGALSVQAVRGVLDAASAKRVDALGEVLRTYPEAALTLEHGPDDAGLATLVRDRLSARGVTLGLQPAGLPGLYVALP